MWKVLQRLFTKKDKTLVGATGDQHAAPGRNAKRIELLEARVAKFDAEGVTGQAVDSLKHELAYRRARHAAGQGE